MNRFYNPVRVHLGENCLDDLSMACKDAVCGRVNSRLLLLVFDKSVLSLRAFQKILVEFPQTTVWEWSKSNPDIRDLFELYQKAKGERFDLVIAVGGGSVMDMGKSLCVVLKEDLASVEDLRDLIAERRYGDPEIPWIGVPTTAGTGSEVTCWATVWDRENLKKFSIETPNNFAHSAFACSRLVQKLPLPLAVSSALDAASHAIESYWAKQTNDISKIFALEAVHLIFTALPALVERQNPEATSVLLMRGSLLAGLAFSNTHTTAVHSISYPLSMLFHMPHGVAVSLVLGGVFQMNAPHVPGISKLLKNLGVKDAGELDALVQKYLSAAGFETKLSKWGATDETLKLAAKNSLTRGRADNNPVLLTEENVLKILQQIKE